MKPYIIIIAVVLAAGITVAAYLFLNRDNGNDAYEYNMKVFDTGALTYSEAAPIPVNGSPKAIAVDGELVHIAVGSHIHTFNTNGSTLRSIDAGGEVYCLAASGDIFAGLKNHIEVIDGRGRKTVWQYTDERAHLTSIAVRGNNVYAVDYKNRIVWHYDRSGTLKGTIARRDEARGVPGLIMPSPYADVAIAVDDSVWVANTGRLSLEHYSPDGKFLGSWGKPGIAAGDFPGCCNPAHFVLLPDGGFAASEKGLFRVKAFDGNGVFTGIAARTEAFHPATRPGDIAADNKGRIYVLDSYQKSVRVFEKRKKQDALNGK